MDKWKEYYDYYKRNPINYYEDMLGAKFTKLQKIKLKIYIGTIDYLIELIFKNKDLQEELIQEPFGTIRYEILKLQSAILELKIDIIRSIFKV